MHTRRLAEGLAAIAGLLCLVAAPAGRATTVVSGPAPSDHRACAIIAGVDDYSGADGNLPNLATSVADAQSLAEALSAWPCYRGTGGTPAVQLLLPHAGLEIGSLSVLNAIDVARSDVGEGDLILVYLSTWRQWDVDSQQWRLLLPDYSPSRRGSFVTLDRVAQKLSGTHANVVYLLNCPVLGHPAPLDTTAFLEGPPGANRAVLGLEGSAEQLHASGAEHSLLSEAMISALQRDGGRSGSTFSELAASLKQSVGARALASPPTVSAAQQAATDLVVTWVVSSPAKRKALEIAMGFYARRVPYRMGTQSMARTDDSGLVWYCFTHGGVWPKDTPRTNGAGQSKIGTQVPPGDPLQPGDRLYFDTPRLGYGVMDHTGIYIGDGKMVHATPMHVKITNLKGYLKVAKAMRDP